MIYCLGVMAARGVLQNPALFQGHSTAPLECIEDWIYLGYINNCKQN